jgi:hypothetical protein
MFRVGLLTKQWCHLNFPITESKTQIGIDRKNGKRSLVPVSEHESTKAVQLARKMASLEFPEGECTDFSEFDFER